MIYHLKIDISTCKNIPIKKNKNSHNISSDEFKTKVQLVAITIKVAKGVRVHGFNFHFTTI